MHTFIIYIYIIKCICIKHLVQNKTVHDCSKYYLCEKYMGPFAHLWGLFFFKQLAKITYYLRFIYLEKWLIFFFLSILYIVIT